MNEKPVKVHSSSHCTLPDLFLQLDVTSKVDDSAILHSLFRGLGSDVAGAGSVGIGGDTDSETLERINCNVYLVWI